MSNYVSVKISNKTWNAYARNPNGSGRLCILPSKSHWPDEADQPSLSDIQHLSYYQIHWHALESKNMVLSHLRVSINIISEDITNVGVGCPAVLG